RGRGGVEGGGGGADDVDLLARLGGGGGPVERGHRHGVDAAARVRVRDGSCTRLARAAVAEVPYVASSPGSVRGKHHGLTGPRRRRRGGDGGSGRLRLAGWGEDEQRH